MSQEIQGSPLQLAARCNQMQAQRLNDFIHMQIAEQAVLNAYLWLFVQLMANIDPRLRPTAASLTHHSTVCPFRRKSRAQLCRELNEEKMKNELLSRSVTHCTTHSF